MILHSYIRIRNYTFIHEPVGTDHPDPPALSADAQVEDRGAIGNGANGPDGWAMMHHSRTFWRRENWSFAEFRHI